MTPINSRTGQPERLGKIIYVRGKKQEDTAYITAGDIGAVTKLAATETGDALCDPKKVLNFDPINFPKPCLQIDVYKRQSSDCSVSAVSDGVVVSAGWNTSRGYSVQIVDENDMIWVYSHMDSLDVNAGDVVSTGDKIGVVGYTGWAEQIQLELELWYGGCLLYTSRCV